MKRVLILIGLLLLLTGCINQNQEQQVKPTITPTKAATNVENSNVVIEFKNPQIEAKVREVLGKSTSDITEKDVLKITELDLDDVEISSFTELTLFKNLKKLRLGFSIVRNLEGIEKLSKLESLWLRRNNIVDITPLASLTSLKELDIAENNVTDFTPIENLTNLVSLGIGDNNSNISDLSFLKNLTKLESLYAPWCGITNINALSDLTKLNYLNLNSNSITDITPLKKLNKLDYLQLDNNQIVDISILEHLTNITSIFIDNNPIDKEQKDKFFAITEKDIKTVHFKEQVSRDLPLYDFAVQGYRTKDGYDYVANSITISNNGKAIQKIELAKDELTGYPTSYDENFGFTIEDMNFDGYKDFNIIKYVPASPNISYCMWFWNPKTNQFEENNDLEQILSPVFDQDKKIISSFTRGSASDHYEDTYQYIEGKLTHIKSIATGYVNDEDPQNTYYIEHQFIKGKWKLIKKEKYELGG